MPAPLHWLGVCCRFCDGGSTAERRNHQPRWMNFSTEWYGTGCSSHYCEVRAGNSASFGAQSCQRSRRFNKTSRHRFHELESGPRSRLLPTGQVTRRKSRRLFRRVNEQEGRASGARRFLRRSSLHPYLLPNYSWEWNPFLRHPIFLIIPKNKKTQCGLFSTAVPLRHFVDAGL